MDNTAELLGRVRRGDPVARERLVARFLPAFRRWAPGRLPPAGRDLAETDDLVQSTLLRALAHVEGFESRGQGSFLAYLRRILMNQVRDEIRRSQHRPQREVLTEEWPSAAPGPVDYVLSQEGLEAYEAALADLLLRRGPALAGADRRGAASTDAEAGILTAAEIATLDLQGVEWAVLAACNTGLGAVQLGEGVLGLRRAFQMAGVRAVILSLWPVADEPMHAWMRALYAARCRHRRSTVDAVHHADADILGARRSRGESTHPFYWAGFVAAGDWREADK